MSPRSLAWAVAAARMSEAASAAVRNFIWGRPPGFGSLVSGRARALRDFGLPAPRAVVVGQWRYLLFSTGMGATAAQTLPVPATGADASTLHVAALAARRRRGRARRSPAC